MTAAFDQDGGEIEVAPLAGRAVELHEGHLELGMTFDGLAAFRPELSLGGCDRTLGDEEETIVAERTVPGDRRLEEMAVAVQLVAPGQVAVLGPGSQDLHEGVEVAIRPLGGHDEPDGLIGHLADGGIPRSAELPASPLEPLVDVRVEEGKRLVEHEPESPIAVAGRRGTRGEREVVQGAGAPELLVTGGDGPLAIGRQPVRPEAPRDPHIRGGEGTEDRRCAAGRKHARVPC